MHSVDIAKRLRALQPEDLAAFEPSCTRNTETRIKMLIRAHTESPESFEVDLRLFEAEVDRAAAAARMDTRFAMEAIAKQLPLSLAGRELIDAVEGTLVVAVPPDMTPSQVCDLVSEACDRAHPWYGLDHEWCVEPSENTITVRWALHFR